MIEYLGGVTGSLLSTIFIAFIIAALGYLLGAIEIKGISLGTAGVLLVALGFGVLCNYVPSFEIGAKTISLFNAGNFKLISSIGTAMFVTAVGLIAGPKFFRTFNRKSLSYIVMGIVVITAGALTAVVLTLVDSGLTPAMAVGLLTGEIGRAHV